MALLREDTDFYDLLIVKYKSASNQHGLTQPLGTGGKRNSPCYHLLHLCGKCTYVEQIIQMSEESLEKTNPTSNLCGAVAGSRLCKQ